MANKNFFVHNGLTVGSLSIDASTGNILSASTSASTSTATGALVVKGGVGIGGDLYVGGTFSATNLTLAGASVSTGSTIQSFGSQIGSGVTTLNFTTGTTVTTAGTVATISVNTATLMVGTAIVTSTASSTSTTTGALTVAGGVGIAGSVYVGGVVTATNLFVGSSPVLTTANFGNFGVSSLASGTDITLSATTGSVTINDVSTLQSVTGRGATTTNQVTFNNGINVFGTGNFGININGNFTSTLGAMIVAGGQVIGTTASTVLYALNYQHGVAPISTVTIVTYYGQLFLPSLNNTATYNTIYGSYSRLDANTAATTGSAVSSWVGYIAAGATKNGAAQTTIGNHYGFQAADVTQYTATNVYGYASFVNTATGQTKWNIYASGSAPNYFAGQLSVGYTGLTDGFFAVSGAQSIVQNQASIGGTNNYNGNSGGLKVSSLLVGTTATTYLNGIDSVIAYNPVAGSTVLGITGILSRTGLNSTSTPATYQGNNSYININSGATGGTIANGVGYDSFGPVFNGGTTGFTNFSGFRAINVAGTTTASIITAIGFWGNQASTNIGVTNNWNLYMSGTAPNYLNGGLYIGQTTPTSGAVLSVNGGAYVNGTLTATNLFVGSSPVLTTANFGNFGVASLGGLTGTIAISTGSGSGIAITTGSNTLSFTSTDTLQLVTNRGNTTNNAIVITSTAASTSTTTGALQVAGGVGVGGNLYVGNSATVLSTLASTSSVQNNALYVAGGVGIATSLYVTGPAVFSNSVTFSGSATYVNSTNTIYTDNIIELHYPSTGTTWTVNDGKDIGFRFHYYNGGDQNAGLVLANDSKSLEWYASGTEDGTSTFVGGTYGTFKTGAIVLANTTASVSTTTGALQVAGGVGVGGGLYVGGGMYVGGTVTATNITLNTSSIALGYGAGSLSFTTQGLGAVAIGAGAGGSGQGQYSVAVGYSAGTNNNIYAVSIGNLAGQTAQQNYAVAIGASAGNNQQSTGAIAIGNQAALTSQGAYAIAIGNAAGNSSQPQGSIIIAGGSASVNGANTGTYITPIRPDATSSATTFSVYYNPVTRELTTSTVSAGGGATLSATSINSTFYVPFAASQSGSYTVAYNTSTLYFNPSISTLYATVFQSLSDATQKANISIISNGLEIVENLRGVTFDWRNNSGSSAGLLAQDVEQWLPQLVSIDANGVKNLNYSGVIGALVEAVKTLSDRVKILESR